VVIEAVPSAILNLIIEAALIPSCTEMVVSSISEDPELVSLASIENETLITLVEVPVGITLGAGVKVGCDEIVGDGDGA